MQEVAILGGCSRVGYQNCTRHQLPELTLLVDLGAGISSRDAIAQGPNFRDLDSENLNCLFTHFHRDHATGVFKLQEWYPDDFIHFYGSPFTLGGIMSLLEKDRESLWPWQFNAVEPYLVEQLSPDCQISSFPVEHSIMDPRGWSIQAENRHMVHLGDVKYLPVESLAHLEAQGPVDMVFMDATGAYDRGYSPDESKFNELIESMIAASDKKHNRLIIVGFSTHVPRWMSVIRMAAKYGKKVGFLGSSLTKMLSLASEYSDKEFSSHWDWAFCDLADSDVIIVTGCQGEYLAGLFKLAHGIDGNYLQPGDQIVIASRLLPGNEMNLERIVRKIKEDFGHEVTIYRDSRIGTEYYADKRGHYGPSGHGYSRDLEKILRDLLRFSPNLVVVPLHAESPRRAALADIADKLGIASILMGDYDTLRLN